MNKEKIERVTKLLEKMFEINDKELFMAQMLYEKVQVKADIVDLQEADFEEAEKIYEDCYLDHDGISSKWNDSIWEAINGEFDYDWRNEKEEEDYDNT